MLGYCFDSKAKNNNYNFTKEESKAQWNWGACPVLCRKQRVVTGFEPRNCDGKARVPLLHSTFYPGQQGCWHWWPPRATLAGFQSQSYSVSAYCLLPPFPEWEPYIYPSYLGPMHKSPGYLLHCGWLEDLPLTASSAKGGQRGSGGKTQGRRLWCSEVRRSLCWERHGSENVWALQALHDRKT